MLDDSVGSVMQLEGMRSIMQLASEILVGDDCGMTQEYSYLDCGCAGKGQAA